MLHVRIMLTFLFGLLIPLDALAASQSNALVQAEEQRVHTQAEERIEKCAMCLDNIPSWSSVLTIQVFWDITQDVKFQTLIQQITEQLSSSSASGQIEALRSWLRKSHQAASYFEKAAGDIMQRVSFETFIKAFSLAERFIEERLNNLKKRSSEPTLSDNEKGALASQLESAEAQHRTLIKYRKLSSAPNAQQDKILEVLNAFLAEPGMHTLYNLSMAHYLKQSFLDEAEEILLACKHKFHKKCLAGYAKSQCIAAKKPDKISLACPMCRAPFSKADLASLPIEITVADLVAFYEKQGANLYPQAQVLPQPPLIDYMHGRWMPYI